MFMVQEVRSFRDHKLGSTWRRAIMHNSFKWLKWS